jgi:uncharacterized membrane protein
MGSSIVASADGRMSMVDRVLSRARSSPVNQPALGATSMSTFVPATVLVFLGAILTVLGLLVAGSLPLIAIGLMAVFAAGLLSLAPKRS